jgi:hypothetical protein
MVTRGSKAHKEWIKAVKEKGGHLCAWCHVTDNLTAHHIKEWDEYPDLRVELSNGIVLCRSCHMRHHKNKKGTAQVPWNKGKKTGKGGPKKGTKFTEEHKLKLRIQKLGKTTWNKGIPMKETTKELQVKRYEGKTWVFDTKLNKRVWLDNNQGGQNVD